MKLFGLLVPSFRKGVSVIIADPVCARGQSAENIFRYLDPKNEYKRNLYGPLKKGAKGRIVAMIKYKDAAGETNIYCGVLIKEILYAVDESRLARA
ncbi:hypothetical protein [Cohnella cholangitidis]|uniref:Uncharacterized protein n=1 Tax=Cohnella cholangitidis TaxID=2598458 RepID=A0A7G5BU67_9BACL|nr:hypothetical protein [Cohnella cholangitidis]QMV40501.1 hypothetical protein FPL14_04235 [Cohnella cholangitidis]